MPSSLTALGANAFELCTNATSITFGENSVLTEISASAFSDCYDFTGIEIPASVTTIGDNAFANARALTSLTFEQGTALQTIGARAFDSCESLTNLVLPEGLKTISESAFDWCGDLLTVTLPSTLQTVAEGAFDSCFALTTATYSGSQLQWYERVTVGTDNDDLIECLTFSVAETPAPQPTPTPTPTPNPQPTPKKGNNAWWIILLCALAVGIAVTAVWLVKSKKIDVILAYFKKKEEAEEIAVAEDTSESSENVDEN